MIYLYLFIEFFKTGLFAIGGGMATLPFLYQISESRGWYTTEQLVDMIAVSESTPGPIGINMSTYVGYATSGILGGIVATLSLVLPSIVIILIIARMLEKFRSNKYVNGGFVGLRPTVTGLIAAASLSVAKVTFFKADTTDIWNFLKSIDLKAVGLFIVLFLAIMKWKKHPIVYILAGAIVGIVIYV